MDRSGSPTYLLARVESPPGPHSITSNIESLRSCASLRPMGTVQLNGSHPQRSPYQSVICFKRKRTEFPKDRVGMSARIQQSLSRFGRSQGGMGISFRSPQYPVMPSVTGFSLKDRACSREIIFRRSFFRSGSHNKMKNPVV